MAQSLLETILAEVLTRVATELHWVLPEKLPLSPTPPHVDADIACTWPLTLAPQLQQSPRAIAEALAAALEKEPEIASVEIAGPGFVNLILADSVYSRLIRDIQLDISESTRTVRDAPYAGTTISVEYISANPTGPMHFGNARGGPLGESLCRLFEALGATVIREFYVNDYGGQAGRFERSVLAKLAARHPRVLSGGEELFPMPEDGYGGDYVADIADAIAIKYQDGTVPSPEELGREGLEMIIAGMQQVCRRLGIHFDIWQRQSALTDAAAAVEETLRANGAAEERDGALWLQSGITEGDRESVLRKSDGMRTYFLDDLAYHKIKLTEHGADVGIVVLGSDHSGHGPRMKSGVIAMGFREDQYEPVFYGRVEFYENGVKRKMSKRSGSFVTLEDMLDELPREVLVYFLVSKAPESAIDFDITLAKDTSERNPVYAIQYAHARSCSVLNKQVGGTADLLDEYQFDAHDRALVRQLIDFSEAVHSAGVERRTHILAHYVHELAIRFHRWYSSHRILDATSEAQVATRVLITAQTKATLATSLRLLGIEPLDRLERTSTEPTE